MLKALNKEVVSPARLLEEAERLILDAPGYWLTPALVATFASISGSKEVAERAALRATRIESGKSALFFSLMAARYGRHDEAGQWFDKYLNSLDCRSLAVDFVPVMDAAGRGDLGALARDRLMAVCIDWRDQHRQDSQLADWQVERWQAFISARRRLDGEFDLPREITAGSHWSEKLELLAASSVFVPMKEWLDEQLASAGLRDDDPPASIDVLLGSLVADHEKGEARLLERIEELHAAAGGHDAGATSATKASSRGPASQPRRDFLELLADVALSTAEGPLHARGPLFTLTISGAFIKEAVLRLQYRSELSKPASIEVAIGDWRHAAPYNATAEELAAEYSEFVKSGMEAELDSPLARLSRKRRDDIHARWQEREKAGKEAILRAITDVHKFYAQWNRQERAAKDCVALIDNNFGTGAGLPVHSRLASGQASHTLRPLSTAIWANCPYGECAKFRRRYRCG